MGTYNLFYPSILVGVSICKFTLRYVLDRRLDEPSVWNYKKLCYCTLHKRMKEPYGVLPLINTKDKVNPYRIQASIIKEKNHEEINLLNMEKELWANIRGRFVGIATPDYRGFKWGARSNKEGNRRFLWFDTYQIQNHIRNHIVKSRYKHK